MAFYGGLVGAVCTCASGWGCNIPGHRAGGAIIVENKPVYGVDIFGNLVLVGYERTTSVQPGPAGPVLAVVPVHKHHRKCHCACACACASACAAPSPAKPSAPSPAKPSPPRGISHVCRGCFGCCPSGSACPYTHDNTDKCCARRR